MEFKLDKEMYALLGVGLGWLLNQSSLYLKLRNEKRRKLKSVISTLLSLYHTLARFETNRLSDALIKELKQKYDIDELEQEETQQYFNDFIEKEMKPYLKSQLNLMKREYQEALRIVSEYEPILAYELRYAINFASTIETFEKVIENKTDSVESKQAFDILKNYLTSEKLKELKEAISKIAFKVGFIQRRKIEAKMISIYEFSLDDTDEVMKEFIEALPEEYNK